MEVISYAKYLASPQYRKFPFEGLVGWIVGNFPPSVEDLQRKYNFTYYSTMGKAVTDVNNGTLANADANKNTAVAGVYTDKDGGKNVVLLKDTTEETRIKPSVDMTINLGGHVLSTDDQVCVDSMSGNVTIDGRLSGSTILVSTSNGRMARPIQVRAGNFVVDGGTYIGNSEGRGVVSGNNSSCLYSLSSIDIRNATIIATETTGIAYGASFASSSATVTNCDIRAYSNYHKEGETYTGFSAGVLNTGTLTINDCYVYGAHCGVNNSGTLYINGGTYEGYGHGGIYFLSAGTTSYVRNATIKDNPKMPEGYTATANHNGAGFYIGSCDNITVYMDNCKIYGSDSQIVLRGSSGEQNNTLKISNSNLYDLDGDYLSVRIDNDTHKLYIGKGCNFTAENTTLPSAVIATDKVYVQGDTHKLYIGKGCNFTAENTTLPSAVIEMDEVCV